MLFNFGHTPVGQRCHRIILHVQLATCFVSEDSTTHGVWGAGSTTRIHSSLCLSYKEAGIELYHVRVIIQVSEDISDIGVSINIFKSIMRLQVKEGSKFIQSCRVPI